jgi:hypothetical protein
MSKSAVQAKINYPATPRIKFVKKAGMWVKTWFEEDSRGNKSQKQQWAMTKEELL